MLSAARAVIRPERDRDGHLTVLDFNSSLIVLCTSVHKSKSLDPSTEWAQTNEFIHPIGSLRSLAWNGIIQRFSLIMPISKWVLDPLFQHQHHQGPSLCIMQVCSLCFLCPPPDYGSHFTYTGLSEYENGHAENGIIDLFPPGWKLWLHSL